MNKKPVIKIKKKKNEGTFKKYCKDNGFKGVTKACVDKGCKSKNSKTKKRACFAKAFVYNTK